MPPRDFFVNAVIEQVMNSYRSGEVRVLVATDVAARGLDVKDISYVINYDFPVDGVEVRPIFVSTRLDNCGICLPPPPPFSTVRKTNTGHEDS